MLGSNIGKKVTAVVVQDEYKQFLKNKPDEKKQKQTAEEKKEAKRAEMRRRGIFVKADDADESPTVMEKADGPAGQTVPFVLPEKKLKWKTSKRTAKRRQKDLKKSTKRADKKSESDASGAQKKKQKIPKKDSFTSVTPTASTPTKRFSAEKPEKPVDSSEEKPSESVKTVEQPENKKEPLKPLEPQPQQPEPLLDLDKTQPPGEPPKEPTEENKKEYTILSAVSSNPSITEMKKDVPMAEKQPDAFDKLDDDEFEKMTSDVDEKEILKLAPKLLKVAKKHAAMEKCLTAEENDVLAKFFSGKQKLDANVLAVLDRALDKIIDYLQKNNCAVDEETKAVMKKRDKLKAAMMKEFLVSPQYLPKTWTAKFNAWKSEAEKQKNGINWFRVLFSYPKHKSFDDGPEDTFGNFNRRARGLLMGILLGPSDVKSFEETKREEDCQGMFLDTRIMEKAQDEKDNSTTDRRSVLTAKK
ncbi:unnamed protein product [Caenorhabditis sp. 36 PRJEB53466]|nr:unnamed protein product [Caenorhabditis sp. 36 PRJEB53466]